MPLLSVGIHSEDPRPSTWLVASPKEKRWESKWGGMAIAEGGSVGQIQELTLSLGSAPCSVTPFTSTSLWPSPLTARSLAKEHETGSGIPINCFPRREHVSYLLLTLVLRGAGRVERGNFGSSTNLWLIKGLPGFLGSWWNWHDINRCVLQLHPEITSQSPPPVSAQREVSGLASSRRPWMLQYWHDGWLGHSDNKGTHHKEGVLLDTHILSMSKDKPMGEIWKNKKFYSFVFS